MFRSTIIPYTELSKELFFELIKLRIEIFVVEQKCYYQELDEEDQIALHVVGQKNGIVIAAGRIIPDVSKMQVSIGRIAVKNGFRNNGFAREMMDEILDYIGHNFKTYSIKLSAQVYLINFYKSFGFKEIGKVYLEDGIEHINMVKK